MSPFRYHFFKRYLSEGDSIRAIFHRHFFVILPNIFFWLTLPLIAVSWAVYHLWYPSILTSDWLWIFEGYLFLIFILILYRILDWYSDVWIITEHGMIDVRWSLMMNDFSFTGYEDVSSVQAYQGSIFDKVCNIGDVTIHKMGDEMHISRLYRPGALVALIQENIQEHEHDHGHHDEEEKKNEVHIYLDGVQKNHLNIPYKNGRKLMPKTEDDDKFLSSVRQQPGTIDLSEHEEPENEEIPGHDSHHHAPHSHGH